MAGAEPARIPGSTYRLQFNSSFTFADAARLVPYLERLGITECYCSPLLAAKPGSVHGYDVCDHSRLNPEIGGREGFQQFSDALKNSGLGLLLDFVPNHMSTDPVANAWWRNVLANGPSSPFAKFFDIDWDPVKSELKGRVLLPVLGDQYGVTLERGELQIVFDDSGFWLKYFDLNLPLNPRELRVLLRHNLGALEVALGNEDRGLTELQSILFHLDHVPRYTNTTLEQIASRQRENEIALQRLAQSRKAPFALRPQALRSLANRVAVLRRFILKLQLELGLRRLNLLAQAPGRFFFRAGDGRFHCALQPCLCGLELFDNVLL